MLQKTYLTVICNIYLFLLGITGFWPFRYNTQIKKFKLNLFYLMTPLILIPYILTIYVIRAHRLTNAVKDLFKNIVLKIISNIYISSNLLNAMFLYCTKNLQYKQIQNLIYRTKNLHENMCTWLPLEDLYYLPYLMKFTIKSLVFVTTLLAYMTVSMTLIAPNVVNLYALPGFLLPILINKFYPDLYYGGLLLADFYLLHINEDLKRIISLNKNVMRNTSEGLNGKEFNDLIDELDMISRNYIELIKIVKEFNRIMSLRVVLWLLLGFLNFLIHLFMQYVFIGIPIRYGHSLNIVIATSGLIDLFYQFMEFWFTTSICSSVMKKVHETETILTSVFIKLRVNSQLARSVTIHQLKQFHVLKCTLP